MSQGLGKRERQILDLLRKRGKESGAEYITALIYHSDWFNEMGDRINLEKCSNAEYKTVLRSLNSLERKGYIESRKQTDRFMRIGEHGGRSYYKEYALTPKTKVLEVNTFGLTTEGE